MSQRLFEINFRLVNSTSPTQRTLISATDPLTARRIFEQQNPQCAIFGSPKELRETPERKTRR
jgi:hypothetical protein